MPLMTVNKKNSYSDLLGDLAPTTKMTSVFFKPNGDPNAGMAMASLGLAVVGSVAGYNLWKKHSVLGAFAGGALGAAVIPVAKGTNGDQMTAMQHAIGVGGGVAASLAWKKHPVWGFILGQIGADLAAGAVMPKPKGTVLAGMAGKLPPLVPPPKPLIPAPLPIMRTY